MTDPYEQYVANRTEDINELLNELHCQPILFLGSGLSQRYFDAPTWEDLLAHLAEECPLIDKDIEYYLQAQNSLAAIGTVFSNAYREWAWGDGRENFPDKLYDSGFSGDIYIKYRVSEYLKGITPEEPDAVDDQFQDELTLLADIHPHAIITTNYDRFLEAVFPDFEPIIGEEILHQDHTSIGEIFKIHGCVSQVDSLVLTTQDYEEFLAKKKYLSAKLLTYLLEHPVLFVGYSAEDQNVRAILADVDEILTRQSRRINNIYMVDWTPAIDPASTPASEHLIRIDDTRAVRVNKILAKDFDWVFESFGSERAIQDVPVRLLRSLIARNYELVRKELPRGTVEVDYETLEAALEDEDGLAKLYGIAVLEDASEVNAQYPYTLTDVAQELGYDHWYHANQLIQQIADECGVNIKESDNQYHIAIRSGNHVQTRKYSPQAVTLLRHVRDGEDYEVRLNEPDAE